jgi:MerR family copper efflux transcriptional regulator
MRIGDLAGQTGLTTQTLRYYERRGIIAPTSRTASGYREYSPQAVTTVRMVKWLKSLGFTLREIREYRQVLSQDSKLDMSLRGDAARKAEEIEKQIRVLISTRNKLQELAACGCSTGECPLLLQVSGGLTFDHQAGHDARHLAAAPTTAQTVVTARR